jgi:hypothetical protein
MLDPEFVHAKLLETWSHQACRNPGDWPAARDALLAKCGSVVDAAVPQLVKLFSHRVPADPAIAVWRCFPRLDREHCAILATRLMEASGATLRLAG